MFSARRVAAPLLRPTLQRITTKTTNIQPIKLKQSPITRPYTTTKPLNQIVKLGKGLVEEAPRPSNEELKKLFIYAAIPMVGFGLMDNFIMIVAGDAIDNAFGVTFGITTLTAAAFGQVASDVSGVLFGGVVERFCTKFLGIRAPILTAAQRLLPVCKNTILGGSAVGVFIGCMMGASTLLFIDLNKRDDEKKVQELDVILRAVMSHGDEMFESERCGVFFVDEEKREMWSKYVSVGSGESLVPSTNRAIDKTSLEEGEALISVGIDNSLVGLCYLKNDVVNIADVDKKNNDNHDSQLDKKTGFICRNILCAPVRNAETGKVVAVVEFINKKEGAKAPLFDESDEKLAKMLAHHVGIFLERIRVREEDEK